MQAENPVAPRPASGARGASHQRSWPGLRWRRTAAHGRPGQLCGSRACKPCRGPSARALRKGFGGRVISAAPQPSRRRPGGIYLWKFGGGSCWCSSPARLGVARCPASSVLPARWTEAFSREARAGHDGMDECCPAPSKDPSPCSAQTISWCPWRLQMGLVRAETRPAAWSKLLGADALPSLPARSEGRAGGPRRILDAWILGRATTAITPAAPSCRAELQVAEQGRFGADWSGAASAPQCPAAGSAVCCGRPLA